MILKNYGISATAVEAFLSSNDPYITIHDGYTDFGTIASGDTASNTSDPYSIEAAAGAPGGHLADFMLVANSQGAYSDTSNFSICIGKFNYIVWDPSPDMSSGPIIDATLQTLGYSGMFSQTLPVTELDRYTAVFVSVGMYGDNYVIENGSPEAVALVDFLNSGGRMYLEGGDVWYWDPQVMNGYDFGPLFKINATADGSSDLVTVFGQSSVFTAGMNFSYSGENSYVDQISSESGGMLIFQNSAPVYDCGVANDAGTYKTVGVSFELTGLVDASPPSTKETLVDSIMHFFGLSVGVQENPLRAISAPKVYSLSQNYPNPFALETTISYALPKISDVCISLYDAAGRRVKKLVQEQQLPGYYTIQIDGGEMKAGIYFIRFTAGDVSLSHKCIIIK